MNNPILATQPKLLSHDNCHIVSYQFYPLQENTVITIDISLV